MGIWSYYFLAKLGLFAVGLLGFHWIPNLILALVVAAPVPHRPLRRLRRWLVLPVAVALLWYDSHWPPFTRVLSEWRTLLQFTPAYWLELLSRSISWRILGGLLLGGMLWYAINKRVRLGSLVIVGMLCVPLWELWSSHQARPAASADTRSEKPVSAATVAAPSDNLRAPVPLDPPVLTKFLQRFYDQQQGLSVPIEKSAQPPFDLVFLSVCSLSWDDLAAVGLSSHPVLQRFDLLFRRFNTAASYSGPAVLRLLQGTCGQPPQGALYQPAPTHCYLFQQLERLGYETEVRMNHQGQLAGFAQQIREFGRASKVTLPDSAAPVTMTGVDGTPIRSDVETLKEWLAQAPRSSRPRALLYNTITLHDGNEIPGIGAQVTHETYRKVTEKFLQDLAGFIRMVEATGRPTVVVLVPEHGAAIKGDARQIAGLREFPTPRITEVPAGVALLSFGIDRPRSGPVVVDRVSSYMALTGAISSLLHAPRAQAHAVLRQVPSQLPPLSWVAENDSTIVIREQSRTYIRTGSSDWSEYPADPAGK